MPKNKNVDLEIERLKNRMAKLLTDKSYSANRNHVNKIADQIRYLERSFVSEKGE